MTNDASFTRTPRHSLTEVRNSFSSNRSLRRNKGIEDIILTQKGILRRVPYSSDKGRSFTMYIDPEGNYVPVMQAHVLRRTYAHAIYQHYRALEAGRW